MSQTNKLTVYLIKDRFTKNEEIIGSKRKKIVIEGVGNFYTEDSYIHPPAWIESFFEGKLGNVDFLHVASSKGVLLTKITVKKKMVRFAISFGMGRHLFNDDVIEERFGLKVTLNTVLANSIRSIEKANIGANSKISKEQMSKNTDTREFGIDIEQDLIRAVTGKAKPVGLGKTVSGADALSVSVEVNVNNLEPFLKRCYERYISNDYKKDFDWIDQIQEIKNPVTVDTLDNILTDRFNKQDFEKLWMTVPDLMDWSDLAGFKYIPYVKELSDDLEIEDFCAAIGTIESINDLRHKPVFAKSASTDNEIGHWNAYKCLYGEVSFKDKEYVINNGKWFEINKDFVTEVNKTYDEMKLSTLALPDYNHDGEGEYNEFVAKNDSKFLLMDKKTVMFGGAHNKIEFCDLLSKNKEIVHVKHYGASSVLSHLFQQGLNSGEYFTADSNFRSKLNTKLKRGWKLKFPSSKINASDYEIVFAIISRKNNPRPSIPFFSKVSIKNVKRRLEGFNYKVSLVRIKSLRK
jgi:uncharacterized protein (TIGR04141 family)